MLREEKVNLYLRERGLEEADSAVIEKMNLKVFELLEKAIKKAMEEGRKYILPSDIKVSKEFLKGNTIRRQLASKPATKPLVERTVSSRLGGFIRTENREQ